MTDSMPITNSSRFRVRHFDAEDDWAAYHRILSFGRPLRVFDLSAMRPLVDVHTQLDAPTQSWPTGRIWAGECDGKVTSIVHVLVYPGMAEIRRAVTDSETPDLLAWMVAGAVLRISLIEGVSHMRLGVDVTREQARMLVGPAEMTEDGSGLTIAIDGIQSHSNGIGAVG